MWKQNTLPDGSVWEHQECPEYRLDREVGKTDVVVTVKRANGGSGATALTSEAGVEVALRVLAAAVVELEAAGAYSW